MNKTLRVFSIMFILLVACQSAVKPEEVVRAMIEAERIGDLEAQIALFADDAVHSILPPSPDLPDPIVGKDAIRARLAEFAALNAERNHTEITEVDGNLVTTLSRYADDELRSLGLEFIEGTEEYVIQDGKITAYTWTMTDESLAELMAAVPEETAPTPERTLVSTSEAIVGIWESVDGGYVQYNADGTSRSGGSLYVLENIPSVQGEYWFEEGRYVVKETDISGLPSCGDKLGIYEVYLLEDGSLSFEVVDDECEDRARASVTVLKPAD